MKSVELGKRFIDNPLTPSVLAALGVLQDETVSALYDNKVKHLNTIYGIWTTDGYVKNKNKFLGELSLSRTAISQDEFQLAIEQIYYNADFVNHRITSTMVCRNNPLASPVSWKLTCDFTDASKSRLYDNSNFTETARFVGNEVNRIISGSSFKRKVSDNFTSDWSLLSVINRLPFDASVRYEFDMLEGLRRFRKNNILVYKGKTEFHHFQQIGTGILPYDYWLNDEHLLVMVITGNRAYIPMDLIAGDWKKRSEANDED